MPPDTQTRYPLQKDFRYLHEPLGDDLSTRWVVGRNRYAQELADRIILSRGGAFLVSGLRGVGKTTCVRLAMHSIRADRARYGALVGDFELVDVWLNLARPLEPVQLLHHLIRHLYLRLKETRLLHRLDPELQKDLNTAFLRTSFEISSRSISGEENGRSSEVGFGKAPWLGIEFLGKISSSHKETRSDEDALKYLPYDEKAAEFEILNFSRRLLDGIDPTLTFWERLLKRLGRVHESIPRIKVVFVLDELDKLDNASGPGGTSPLDPILQSLKTVFAASDFSFVFIGGKEVEERLLDDVSHGDSIYESIFAYDLYLPCLWNEQDEIVDRCFSLVSTPQTRSHADTVALYLRYKGRGVPRRTWRELNKHVRWEKDVPILTLDLEHRRYMQIFAKLEAALGEDDLFKLNSRAVDDAQRDRQRLSFYYTSDWIFTRGRETFTEVELVNMASTLNLGGILTADATEQIARSTLRLLLSRAFIENASQDLTRISPSEGGSQYRLAPWVLLAFQGSPEQQWTPDETLAVERRPETPDIKQIGPYSVISKVGSGGFSNVYKVRDFAGRVFAAKLLHAEIASSTAAASLFKTETRVLQQLNHPGVVTFHASGEQDGRPYLIMDLLEGVSLRDLLDNLKTMEVPLACRIASEVADICQYIHTAQLVRLDIKPANIFITRTGEVKLLDLGIIKNVALPSDTAFGVTRMTIGTFGYMAPEQITADTTDARSDVYALGIVLYEMLAGQTPFPTSSSEYENLRATVTQDAPSLLTLVSVPNPLAHAVMKSIARNPDDRFLSMSDLRTAILPFAADTSEPILLALKSGIASRNLSRSDTVIRPATPVTVAQPVPSMSSAPAVAASAPAPPPPPIPRSPEPPSSTPATTPPISLPAFERHRIAFDESPPPVLSYAPPPQTVSATDAPDQMQQLRRELRNGRAQAQEVAFANLCAVTGTLHLLFDFARNVCLWGGRDAQDRKISLPVPRLILGRGASVVDLALEDPAVSRQHIAFFPTPDNNRTFTAEDLSSAGGTLLNGERLRRKELSDGDVLRVGSREIKIHLLPPDRTIYMS